MVRHHQSDRYQRNVRPAMTRGRLVALETACCQGSQAGAGPPGPELGTEQSVSSDGDSVSAENLILA